MLRLGVDNIGKDNKMCITLRNYHRMGEIGKQISQGSRY